MIAPKRAAREPKYECVVIPNAWHRAILDNPQFFMEHLMAFLRKWAASCFALPCSLMSTASIASCIRSLT